MTTGTAAGSPPDPIVAVPVRHWGRWVGALVVLVLLGLLVRSFVVADIDYGVTRKFLTFHTIIRGAENTVLVSVLAQLMGILLGIVFAVMRRSANPVTSSVAWFYIWLFRGTPLILQLLLWYNLSSVFPTLGFPGLGHANTNNVMTPFVSALLGLGINEGAYMAEIVRAGITSVDEGQTEAAQALGMSQGLALRRIVLPQAMRVIVPPTGNEFINMLKSSSLASVASYVELLKAAENAYNTNLQIIPTLFSAAVWYLVLTSIFSVGQFYLERRFARGSSRTLPATPLQKVAAMLRPGRVAT